MGGLARDFTLLLGAINGDIWEKNPKVTSQCDRDTRNSKTKSKKNGTGRGRAWFEKEEYIIIVYNYRVVSREGTKKNGTISSEEAKEEISCSFFVYFFFQEDIVIGYLIEKLNWSSCKDN